MKIAKPMFLALALALAGGSAGNWNVEIDRQPDGHVVGNPEAESVLTEYVSYTCSHCATFTKEGEPALQLAVVGPGKMRFEVRPVVRNALDLTISMLAACGDTTKWPQNHAMFMHRQDTWLDKARKAPRSQQSIWGRGDADARRNMTNALGLDDMMETRGYSAIEIDRCLADDNAADALMESTRRAFGEEGVQGTPSFAIDGELLQDVHNWRALEPVIADHLAAQKAD